MQNMGFARLRGEGNELLKLIGDVWGNYNPKSFFRRKVNFSAP